MKGLFSRLSLLLFLVATPALAQQRGVTYFLHGTGFFINRQGKIITNAHVVDHCTSVVVSVPKGDLPAKIVARDEARDLAVLQVNGNEVPALASLRWNIDDLRLGSEVVILGYPGNEGAAGRSTFVKTKVNGMVGPNGEPSVLQLASVARGGNSGGPVLDTAGNVIAVITGTAWEYQVDAQGRQFGPPTGKVDIAITLKSLQEFLDQHRISFYQSTSGETGYGDKILARNAAQFIIPIRCYQAGKPER